jgi:predicted Fe-S protein YdhL (DUF1289 family)
VIESPCTKVCVMDADDRYCLGCKRTLNEIARWSEMDETERTSITAELAGRRSTASSDIAEVSSTPLA